MAYAQQLSLPLLAIVASSRSWGAARAQFDEYEDGCSYKLLPGTATEGESRLVRDGEALLEEAFMLTGEYSRLPDEEAQQINVGHEAGCAPSTYVSMPVDDIYWHPGFAVGPGSRVLDLGAGPGRPTMRAVLFHGAEVGLGVELSRTRVRAGCLALSKLSELLSDPSQRPRDLSGGKIELRIGDVLTAHVASATHVVIFATCFPPNVTTSLQDKLLQELPEGARIFLAGDKGHWRSGLAGTHDRRGWQMLQSSAADGDGEDDILKRLWRVSSGSGERIPVKATRQVDQEL